ncbi:hypothetical protein BS47DRAFT_1302198 [Hydnum rufescens UP504]|uniref:Uncharacterized protein n=1 Tax=Hydnum rufescens UP504 TaxID=1448309 RepID=A0A9P6DSR4_9AGAM|nr:hypothetical protein BS47DRAFT_1302198 [Hydnum rufescens UP504]
MSACYIPPSQTQYFPLCPVYPTLAINLNLLHFTSTVFKVEQPNIHSWTMSLEIFL